MRLLAVLARPGRRSPWWPRRSPNCSTRTPRVRGLDGGHGGERLVDELLGLLVGARAA